MWEASHKKAVVEIPLRIWNQIDKSHPDCDELFDRSYQIISVEEFFHPWFAIFCFLSPTAISAMVTVNLLTIGNQIFNSSSGLVEAYSLELF
ncbi:MAG: hypothetical protein HC930_04320 [Hydrococcus sp. SU_1_0]|nr:hypothetical protein [Hydrococcus sp. SU_1_0]